MNRRTFIATTSVGSALGESAYASASDTHKRESFQRPRGGDTYALALDGTALYVQDFGRGRPILFLSAWTLDSRFWGTHIAALVNHGFRCVAFDRRGHGRSDAPSTGYDADTLSTDLAAVLEQRDLRDVVLVAHSMGSGEAVRYLARPGRERVSKLVLVAPTTPFIRKTDDNPHGVPGSLIDGMLDEVAHDFPKWVSDNEAPFFTPDTPQETRTWIKTMMLGVPLPIALTHRDQAGRTDFRADTREVRQPTLILHGDKDASAPLSVTGARTLELLRDGKLVVYENAPHALPLTHRERFLQDLESFART